MPESQSPHHETVAAGTLRALPLLCPLCWRCTLFFLSSRQGLIRAATAIEGSVADWLTEGAASLSAERAGGRNVRPATGRKTRGRTGVGRARPAGLLPIPLRGSGPRRLGWEDGVETGMDCSGRQSTGPETGRSGRGQAPRPPEPPPGGAAGRPAPPEAVWPGPLAQPPLPQAPSSRARE